MEHYLPLAEMIGFKGINADFIPEMLPQADNPIYLTDGNDILIRNGKIEKAPGVDYFNSIDTALGVPGAREVLGLPIFENYENEKYLMAFTPEKVHYLKDASTWQDIGLTLNGSINSILSHANIQNKCAFVLDDDGTIYTWDGSAAAQLKPLATLGTRFLLAHKTYLVLLRPIDATVERYNTIWPSYPGDITTFQAADKLTIATGRAIQGGRTLEDQIIVYFGDSIHRVFWVSDDEGWGTYPVVEGQGLIAQRSLCGNRGVHFFLTKDGFVGYRLGQNPVPLSWSKFNRLIIDGIDPLYYRKTTARYFQDTGLIYVSFPPAGESENGTLLVYDVNNNELVGKKELTGISYSTFGQYEKDLTGMDPDTRRLYGLGGVPLIGTTDGQVFEQKINSYQHVASNYESNMALPPLFFGDRHKNKRVLQCDILVEKLTDEDITFSIGLANEANVVTTTEYTCVGDGNEGIRRYTVNIDSFGKEFRPTFKDVDNMYGWKLHGLVFRGYYAGLK